jgi:hypothetical protein
MMNYKHTISENTDVTASTMPHFFDLFAHHTKLQSQTGQEKNLKKSSKIQQKNTDSITPKLSNDDSESEDGNSVTEESMSTKGSDISPEIAPKKSTLSQKKSYKKAPQGKMDTSDEDLLLILASKYKHDWKKVSKKIFKLNKKKLGPNLLRIRYKELAPDLTQKRVRFTHTEDLDIVKYYSQYGYDWEKIASHFEARTAIMVKNRFYHIKKKNILEKLLEEVESTEIVPQQPATQIQPSSPTENLIETTFPEENRESFCCFLQKGEEIISRTVKLPSFDLFFDFEAREDQLCEKITPIFEEGPNEHLFHEDLYKFHSDYRSNQLYLYF